MPAHHSTPSPSRPSPSRAATTYAAGLWPKGRETLRLDEFAWLLSVTVQHAQNLATRGQLQTLESRRRARRTDRIDKKGFLAFIAQRLLPQPNAS